MDPIQLLIWLAVIVVAAIAAWYILTQLSLPEPIHKIVMILVVVVVAIVVIYFLTSLGGGHAVLKTP